MTKHTGTRQEWLTARLELLEAEKELTRQSDALALRRQSLPWVRIDKAYRFDTDEGSASLKELFRGRSQLLVYHFMFGTDWAAGCPSCSMIADGFNGFAVHLANHDVMLWAVSRAPLAKLQAYKRRMGWTFPWASSSGSDFNSDFNVWFTERQQREGDVEYNYGREPRFVWREGQDGGGQSAEDSFAAMCGTDTAAFHRDRPGMSAFAFEDGAGWTRSGVHTSGSIAPPEDATKQAYGGAATTNTANAEPSRVSKIAGRWRNRECKGSRARCPCERQHFDPLSTQHIETTLVCRICCRRDSPKSFVGPLTKKIDSDSRQESRHRFE